jgi:hypothetical protein
MCRSNRETEIYLSPPTNRQLPTVLIPLALLLDVVLRRPSRAMEVDEGLPPGLLPNLFPHLAGLQIALFSLEQGGAVS